MRAPSLQSCPTVCNPLDCNPSGCSVFSRQEYWSELPCSPLGDLPDPGIETESLMSPALQANSLPTESSGKPSLGILFTKPYNVDGSSMHVWGEGLVHVSVDFSGGSVGQ